MGAPAKLLAERERACRLRPDRALESFEETAEWVRERGMVEVTPCCSLPSFHVACHEEPYKPGGRGFAAYPKTKYPWGFRLMGEPGFTALRIHRGKTLVLAEPITRLVDPLARAELDRAAAGEHGADAALLVAHLETAGPSLVEELKEELAFDSGRLRKARERLERVSAVLSRSVRVDLPDGSHRHTSELRRWDQRFAEPTDGGLADLVLAGVRAAVVAPRRDAERWFSWPARDPVSELVTAGRLAESEGFVWAA